MKSKSEMKNMVIDLIKELHDKNQIKVEKIHCNNLGKNRSLQQQAAKQDRLGITFKFTARKMPQQNGRIEQKFATLFGHVRAMLNGAGFINAHESLGRGLWAECTATATKLENIIVSQNKKVPAHKLFYGVDAPYLKHLRTFGKVGIVHDAQRIRAKLKNRVKGFLFVRYANNHGEGVYRMFNLQTCHIWTT